MSRTLLFLVVIFATIHVSLGYIAFKVPFADGARHWRSHDKVREFLKGFEPNPRPQTGVVTSVLLYSLRNAQKAFSLVQGEDEAAAALMWEAFTVENELLASNSVWDSNQNDDGWTVIWGSWAKSMNFLERNDVQLWLDRSKKHLFQITEGPGIGVTYRTESVAAPSNQADPSKVTVTLNNGIEMPYLGFGTWMMGWDQVINPVKAAMNAGIRRFETSNNYMNEKEIGEVIAESGLGREEFFISTTLHSAEDFGTEATRERFEEQLEILGSDYIDLYMIHGPIADKELQQEAWETMEDLYDEGKIRALGVSNYDENELAALLEYAIIPPAVVQNKFDIYTPGWYHPNPHKSMIQTCSEHGIQLVGYSTLNSWPFDHQPMEDPHVKSIALRLGLTPAQVLLRWALEMGVSMIPRSSNYQRIQENASVYTYDLDDTSMRLLNGIFTLSAPFPRVDYVEDVYQLQVLKPLADPGSPKSEL